MASSLTGQSILLVEDEPFIALDVAEALERIGGQVATAHSLEQALEMLDQNEWSAAVLDYALGDGNCVPISDWLTEHGIPFVVLTGYEDLEGSVGASIIFSKPVASEAVVAAVEKLARMNSVDALSLRQTAFTIQQP